MPAKIRLSTIVVCMLFMSACMPALIQVGGNVGVLTKDEQTIIALDLFDITKDSLDRSVVITMRPQTHGESVFIDALRQAGFGVRLVESNPDVTLDFYFFSELSEYAGVATIGNRRRVIRRYAEENSTLVALGTSVAWPGIKRE